jgi:hypothetical protein
MFSILSDTFLHFYSAVIFFRYLPQATVDGVTVDEIGVIEGELKHSRMLLNYC